MKGTDAEGKNMLEVGVQTQNVITDENPYGGFELLREAGFTCCDFSLNGYLKNTDIYRANKNNFFDQSVEKLECFFSEHKSAAQKNKIRINQMHMPYPVYIPNGKEKLNDYMWNEVAPKSMEICRFLECQNIVIHGFKLSYFWGTEEAEWQKTREFLDTILPMAKAYGITVCLENLYESVGGHLVEGPGCDARKMVERIDCINAEYGAEVLGFCFDTGHANLVGLDFEKFITTLATRLKVLHIHDNDGVGDLHQIPYTFTKTRENKSSTDWEGFVKGLRTIDFDGVLSFETAPVLNAFPEALKKDVLHLIASIGWNFEQKIRNMESAIHGV